MDNSLLGKRIRSARGDLSLREFAKKCGISHTHLDSIEKGVDPRTGKPVSVSMDTLAKLSIGSGLSIDYLMGKEDSAFDGTPFEGKSRTQVQLILFAEFMDQLEKQNPNLTDTEKEACMLEFYKQDPVDVLLSYFQLNDENKRYINQTMELLREKQEKEGGEGEK